MKKIYVKLMAVAVIAAAALSVGCEEESTADAPKPSSEIVNRAAIKTITPLTDESGSVRVFTGDTVLLTGVNLNAIDSIAVNTADTKKVAGILDKSLKELRFIVPDMGFAQHDNPYYTMLYVMQKSDTVYRANFYVTVPVTDAIIGGFTPTEGTIGTEITVSGRNLDKLTEITFGDNAVSADNFISQSGDQVVFAIPAATYAAGNSNIEISATWQGGTLAVTDEATFTMKTPSATASAPQAAGENALLGAETAFTGTNLDLIEKVVWGTYEMLLTDQTATTLTVKIPSTIEQTTPTVTSNDLTAVWGNPDQNYRLAEAFRIDTTPVGPARPVCTSMTAQDGGTENKFYLNKVVTVVGENLVNVEGIKVDGVAATVMDGTTDIELKFIVPDGVTFTSAKKVEIEALYNEGNSVSFGNATVYPFYYWKDVVIGANDVTNSGIAFFVPDAGGVVAADSWSDPYASATVQSDQNALNKSEVTEAQYYSVKPYIFVTSGASFSFIGPANSNSQLKNIKKKDGTAVAGSGVYGTPIIGYRNLEYSGASATEAAYADSIKKNSIESLAALSDKRASSGAPKFNRTSAVSNSFKIGHVLLVQYVTYEFGKLTGLTEDGVRNNGYIYVKSMSPVPETDGNLDKKTTLTLDIYWSKPLN